MLTRCPACQTVFRLSAEQLAARAGKVRCGHCFHPFDAPAHEVLQHGSSDSKLPPSAASDGNELVEDSASAAKAFFILEDKPAASAPVQDFVAIAAPAAPALDFDLPEDTLSSSASASGTPPSLPEVVRSGRRPSLSTVLPADELKEDKLAFAYDPERALGIDGRPRRQQSSNFDTFPALAEAVRDNDRGALDSSPALVAPEHEVREFAVPATVTANTEEAEDSEGFAQQLSTARAGRSSHASAPIAEQDNEQAVAPVAAHVDLRELDARYGRPSAQHSPRRQAWTLALGLVLIGTLGLQSLYLYRGELARQWPALQPLLEQACQAVACEIPLARRLQELDLISSDLERESRQGDDYLLHLALRNRAKHEQAWPHVELTLTDARDLPLARRVLSPTEWLPADESQPTLAGGRQLSTQLRLHANNLEPSGYRVFLFYP